MNIEDANPALSETVEKSTPMKEWLVEYVGNQCKPDDGDVTVEMVLETMANEFPEFLMVVAEENWIRGYHQALTDVENAQAEYDKATQDAQQEDGSDN